MVSLVSDMDFTIINLIWISVALITFLSLVVLKVRAPYGRHSNNNWGVMISNKWGWFFMELPAFLLMPALALFGPAPKNEVTYLLVALWVLHYGNRTLVYPFRIKTNHKKMPLLIALSAILFNGMNGFLNGYFLGYLNESLYSFTEVHVIAGLIIFITGMIINISSDNTLIALRKGADGYRIPNGGLFQYVSCPNHFGEIVEWIGFMVLAWNLPSITFAVWTFCNLCPRSLNHHHWYFEQFSDYPKRRKALIPFIL